MNHIFNRDFYPTPAEVIGNMLFQSEINGKTILEPSAGKGDIVDYLKEYGAKEVIACEINNDLAKIVAGKCRLLASDFLTVRSTDISHVDYIVMNPPFSADENHILHAWEIAPDGCTVISLCNNNIIDRGYSAKQEQIRELINTYGRSQYFGSCFSTAEHATDVCVACIWLYKPKTGDEEFSDYFDLSDEQMESFQQGIVKYNYVRDIVNRYVSAIKLWDRVIPLANEINELTKPISEYGIKFGAYETGKSNYGEITREAYRKELQKKAWQRIFDDMKMQKYVTRGVMETINKFVEQQVHVPFTMRNIYKMLEIIVGTHAGRINQVIIDAFENICKYAWKENCTGGEHWKTNSDYTVNRKFIVPYICEFNDWNRTNRVNINYGGKSVDLDDIVKALCYITGTNYNVCTPLSEFAYQLKMEWGKQYEWGFFRIRGYKKGTMHFEFVDEKVWEMFNRRVAEIKGWRLPETGNATKQARKKSTGLVTAR
jgi:predicted RNA methylase